MPLFFYEKEQGRISILPLYIIPNPDQCHDLGLPPKLPCLYYETPDCHPTIDLLDRAFVL